MGTIKQNFANNIETSGKFDAQDLTGTIPAANIANASLSDITTVPPTASGGDLIQSVASDPPAPDFGDVWYNSTEQKIKLKALGVGSWATGGNLNTGRQSLNGGNVGTSTAGLTYGGAATPGDTGATEAYNGSTWTELNDMNTARNQMMRAGIQTSALAVSGGTNFDVEVESWNGTSWTEVADLNSTRRAGGGAGESNTSALVFGGQTPPAPANAVTANTESWNGSAWTEVNDLNTAKNQLAGTGTQTAALSFSGRTPAPARDIQQNELWNGTSWTEVNDPNTGRENAAVSGTTTSALAFGGRNDPVRLANTEEWNGTSWTEVADLATAREQLGGSGANSNSAIAIGGEGPPAFLPNTEEWTVATPNQSIQGS